MQLYTDVFNYLETRSSEINASNPDVYLSKLDSNERFLCQMTHMHAQVFNGGLMQWEDNGYASRDLDSLRSMQVPLTDLGIYDEVKPFFDFLTLVRAALVSYREVRSQSEPDMYDYAEDEDIDEAWETFEYEQDHAGDDLDPLDDLFYSDEYKGYFNTILQAFFDMT